MTMLTAEIERGNLVIERVGQGDLAHWWGMFRDQSGNIHSGPFGSREDLMRWAKSRGYRKPEERHATV